MNQKIRGSSTMPHGENVILYVSLSIGSVVLIATVTTFIFLGNTLFVAIAGGKIGDVTFEIITDLLRASFPCFISEV